MGKRQEVGCNMVLKSQGFEIVAGDSSGDCGGALSLVEFTLLGSDSLSAEGVKT